MGSTVYQNELQELIRNGLFTCPSEPKSGIAHWNWQGGITDENQKVRNSTEYSNWRKLVFERDNYTCQHCGKQGVELNAHHIMKFSTHHDLRLEVSNGLTLCVPCHKKTY